MKNLIRRFSVKQILLSDVFLSTPLALALILAAEPIAQKVPQYSVCLLGEDRRGVGEHGGQQVFAPAIGVGIYRDNPESRSERNRLDPKICPEIVVQVPIDQAENADRDDRDKQMASSAIGHVLVDQRYQQRGETHGHG